jgi:transcriptional regulator with XRE-family HTH domain
MVAERIRQLREDSGLTQADLARRLGITRSSVNAWELGISVPSTQYVVELAQIFKVSTDYVLGLGSTATVSVKDLTEGDIQLVHRLIEHLRSKNREQAL